MVQRWERLVTKALTKVHQNSWIFKIKEEIGHLHLESLSNKDQGKLSLNAKVIQVDLCHQIGSSSILRWNLHSSLIKKLTKLSNQFLQELPHCQLIYRDIKNSPRKQLKKLEVLVGWHKSKRYTKKIPILGHIEQEARIMKTKRKKTYTVRHENALKHL